MISRFFLGKLDSTVKDTGSLMAIQNRCTGDTRGKALAIIGNLMQLDKPYKVSLKGMEPTIRQDNDLFNYVMQSVYDLKLEYFIFNKQSLTITYDIFLDCTPAYLNGASVHNQEVVIPCKI